MPRILACCTLLAVLALGGQAAPQHDPPRKDLTDAAEVLAGLMKELRSGLVQSTGDAIKRRKLIASYSARFLAHARKYPQDPSAVEALVAVLRFNRPASESRVRTEALALLRKEYVRSPLIREHLRGLVGAVSDQASVDLVRAVCKDNPDRLLRALAARALANGLERRAKLAQVLASDEKARAQHESALGKEVVRHLIDSRPALRKEAKMYRSLLKEDLKGVLPDLSNGTVAPKTVGQDLAGKTAHLSDQKGKVVVLDFWATWSGSCRSMIAPNRELVRKMHGRPFALIDVSVDESRAAVLLFQQQTRMPWTHWWDGRRGKLTQLWDIDVFPTVYVIDHKGIIRYKQVGHDPDSDRLQTTVEKLVKAAEAGRE